jgi:hypothetical protein
MASMAENHAMRLCEGRSINEIARLARLSRNTIKKRLKVPQGVQPKYGRLQVPTKSALNNPVSLVVACSPGDGRWCE